MSIYSHGPLDPRAASKTHEVLTARARMLLAYGEPELYFEHMRFARFIGKFLPINDPRNPDYHIDDNEPVIETGHLS